MAPPSNRRGPKRQPQSGNGQSGATVTTTMSSSASSAPPTTAVSTTSTSGSAATQQQQQTTTTSQPVLASSSSSSQQQQPLQLRQESGSLRDLLDHQSIDIDGANNTSGSNANDQLNRSSEGILGAGSSVGDHGLQGFDASNVGDDRCSQMRGVLNTQRGAASASQDDGESFDHLDQDDDNRELFNASFHGDDAVNNAADHLAALASAAAQQRRHRRDHDIEQEDFANVDPDVDLNLASMDENSRHGSFNSAGANDLGGAVLGPNGRPQFDATNSDEEDDIARRIEQLAIVGVRGQDAHLGNYNQLHNAAAVARGHQNGGHAPPMGWQATKHSMKERFTFMFCNEILADVHFVVGRGDQRQRIPAHKFVLSVGSAVFDAMFNGAMAAQAGDGIAAMAGHNHHSNNNAAQEAAGVGLHLIGQNRHINNQDDPDIDLPDVEPTAFLALLRFLYSDDVTIGPDSVMTTLYTAKKYAVPALENACVDFLKRNLNPDNAFMLLTQARLFDEPQLAALCLEMIDKHTAEALNAEGFTDIDLETLCAVLERDTLRIREAPLYHAVMRWSIEECRRHQLPIIPENQRDVLGRALTLLRFPLMTVEEFAQSAAQSGILNDKELVNLFLYFTVNPKPVVGFLDVPRCSVTGKEQVVNRFQRIEGRWGYSGTPDRIKFTVDRRIFVVGFGLYGSIHGPTEYQVCIQIIHCGTGKVLATNDTTFSCDGSSSTFRVLFKEPVEITPSVTYIASACLKGPDSHYGTKGLRRIVHQSPASGCVTFQFTYAAGNNNGTSVEDGQIPEIIFYTKLT